jgi:hypothetical protein
VDHVTKTLRAAGIPNSEIDRCCDEALASEENELLQICGQWVTRFLVPINRPGTIVQWDGKSLDSFTENRMERPPKPQCPINQFTVR